MELTVSFWIIQVPQGSIPSFLLFVVWELGVWLSVQVGSRVRSVGFIAVGYLLL